MKKILLILLCLSFIISLVACNSTGNNSLAVPVPEATATVEPTKAPEPTAEPTEAPTPEPTEPVGGKTLVVYFSASGNTERVANAIAAATGGDVFPLEPVTPYTSEDLDWRTEGSRVNLEHDDESLRAVELVEDTVGNWSEYDTIYIGYPIWWGIAAWPVDTFIHANDFTGKTVIPFCTSSSSELGESGQLLADMAGTGDWQEGHRFPSSVSDEDVAAWAEGLS